MLFMEKKDIMENELEGLEKWGAHPSEAIARLLGDQTLYRQLVREFYENNDVDLLHFRLEQQDYENAFQIAHSMKGAAASLSLTPLTRALGKLVEDLRPWYEGETDDGTPKPERPPGMTDEAFRAQASDQILYHLRQVDRMWTEYCRFVV